ncbi:DUF4429 domain-containing protein [Streptomyces sp. NPDC058045]|uniref:DUF4429 domain-containing protein n=1 Tax=Streptomyces sp. NPDC058045 TaxID=3346311 RepID=UPI0036E89587
MVEIVQRDGVWGFDGAALRLVPGRERGVGVLRRELGERVVPLAALAGISFEPGRKSGRLRLKLRNGADPLLQVTGGRLDTASDPYQLTVEPDRFGVAEYLVDEVRGALLLEEMPVDEPCVRYLLPSPAVPLSATAGDGTVSFDGNRVRLEWSWKAPEAKATSGPRVLELASLESVEWQPAQGLENGFLRFTVRGAPPGASAKHDPFAVELWGFKKDPLMALVAAAVQYRLPHPATAPAASVPVPPAPPAPAELPPAEEESDTGDHDVLLRRLRELGELHRSGVLTEEEFSTAKQAVLRKM